MNNNENTVAEPTINQQKLETLLQQMQAQQNLPMAVLGGAIAAIVSAAIWAAITVSTHYQIGIVAIGVGFVVGYAVRMMGKGLSPAYGVVGALFALLGCVLGNFLSLVGFISIEEGMGYFEVLRMIDYALVPQLMIDTFHPMDALFYAIALYAGYRYSFHQVPEEQLAGIQD